MSAKELGDRPAYPMSAEDERNHGIDGWGARGLTKREEFAKVALQGFCANPKAFDMLAEEVAGYAAQYADALLAELSKEPTA